MAFKVGGTTVITDGSNGVFNAVSLTQDLGISHGGTGASTKAGARSNLDLGTAALLNSANTTQYRSSTGSHVLTSNNVFSALSGAGITFSTSITLDLVTGINFDLTLTANTTLNNPSNITEGKIGRIKVNQDAAGSRLISSYGSSFVFKDGSPPTLTTNANALDVLYYDCLNSSAVFISSVSDIK